MFEVYGFKGLKNVSFRKTFKSQEAFEKWLDKQDGNVTIEGFSNN